MKRIISRKKTLSFGEQNHIFKYDITSVEYKKKLFFMNKLSFQKNIFYFIEIKIK